MSGNKLMRLSFLPVPMLLILIAVLHSAVNPRLFYEPAWLLPITNTLFVTLVCFAVAYIALKNYRTTGKIQIFLLGCGVLVLGIGGILAAFTRNIPETGANINVTIYNSGALISSIFHFAAALIPMAGISPQVGAKRKMVWLILGCTGLTALMGLLSLATIKGLVPLFFVQGAGPTLLRQQVLGTAAVLFTFSFIIFMTMYWKNREAFLYWYSCALALTSISLMAFLLESSVGNPVGWAGRFSQYLGGIYFLVAIVTAVRSAQTKQTTLDNVLTASFSTAEEKFRVLAENAPDVIRRFDQQGRHVYVNAAGLRLYGRPADLIIGRTLEEAGLPPDYCIRWRERIQHVFNTGRPTQTEEFHRTENGPLFFQSHCVPEFGLNRIVANVLVVSRDLTERKQLEEEIGKSYAELEERVKERTSELVLANEKLKQEIQERLKTEQSIRLEEARLDALLRMNNINAASAAEIANFILEQGIALTQSKIGFVGFLSEDEAVYTLHAVSKNVMKDCNVAGDPMQWHISTAGIWADAIREHRSLFINDYSQSHPSKKGLPPGHPHVERFMVVPLFEGEKIVAVAGVGNKPTIYDKSDERQMILLLSGMFHWVQRQRDREALQEAYKELEQRVEQRTAELAAAKSAAEAANRAKSQFLANISHELRTPMNAILNMVDLALPKQSDPTAVDFLKTAKESADLLLALLNDLLDTAKIESGKLEIESAPFSLRRVVDQAAGILSVRASIKGISFSCRISPEAPEIFVGDQVRLRQVILNLAGNAIKFTEQGRVAVTVYLESQDMNSACLRFEIQDSGIGIRPEDLERIFRPFTQAETSIARRFGGTGLGLSISSSLVELMGGRIWAESEPGKGSTFYFTIRLPVAQELTEELKAPGIVPAAVSRLNILLVEDHLPSQKLAAYILEERGHKVDIAGSGKEALALAQEKLYNVILMDIQMPDMNGVEATAAIRAREQNRQRVPIIAMTAYAMRSDRERCLAAGMDGYLAKPIDKNEMIATVEKLGSSAGDAGRRENSAVSLPETSTVSTVLAFDPDLALRRCYNQPDLLRDMINYLPQEIDRLLPKMHSALEDCDWNTFGSLGHRLKGTLVYLGAEPAAEAAERVERFEQQGGHPTEAREALEALKNQCKTLRALLAAWDHIPESQPFRSQASETP